MKILAIDPGTTKSAFVIFETRTNKIHHFGIEDNAAVASTVKGSDCDVMVVEMIKSYGNAIGDSVLMTCVWIGRFWECFNNGATELIPRKTIVTELCMNPRAKDSNVRQALIDRWGGKEKAIGNAKKPGPLHKISKDVWSALAVAVAWSEMEKLKEIAT